jgi:hypothetical protein
VPSPEAVAIWTRLDEIRPAKIPLWAAHWLVAGYDGEHLDLSVGAGSAGPIRPFLGRMGRVTGRTVGRTSTGVYRSDGAVFCWRTRGGLKGLPSLCDLET